MRQPRGTDPCVNVELLIHPDPCVNLKLLIHPDPCVNLDLLIHPDPCTNLELLIHPDPCSVCLCVCMYILVFVCLGTLQGQMAEMLSGVTAVLPGGNAYRVRWLRCFRALRRFYLYVLYD